MNPAAIQKYILKHKGSKLSYPYGKSLAVFTINDEMFATIEVGKEPTRLSLRCDKLLAKTLKERYEEVMPAYKLSRDKWIRLVLSGQLTKADVEGLIDLSYNMAKEDA